MPNLLTAEIIDKVLAANKEIIHLAHNDDFLTLVTQPLYVTHKIWNETRSIGTLAIRIDFSERQISSPIEIISLTVGYDNPSFPSIPHMGYINQQRQVCWGNYSNMVSSICSDITKLPRHVKMILLFCQSVNAQDLEAVKNFQRLPFEDTSSVIIANCQPKSLDLCWQDLTRNPTSGLGGEFYFVINDSGFPLLLTNIFWQHRYDFVKIKMFTQGHYYQSGESGTKFLSDKWENLKLMQLLDEHSRILSGDEINQLKTTTPKTFRDVPRSVSPPLVQPQPPVVRHALLNKDGKLPKIVMDPAYKREYDNCKKPLPPNPDWIEIEGFGKVTRAEVLAGELRKAKFAVELTDGRLIDYVLVPEIWFVLVRLA